MKSKPRKLKLVRKILLKLTQFLSPLSRMPTVAKQQWTIVTGPHLTRKHANFPSTVPIDASPSKRIAGPGKDLLAKADSLLTLPQDQLQAKIDKYKGAVEHELETNEETGKPDRNSLARLIGKYLTFHLGSGVGFVDPLASFKRYFVC